MNPQYLGYKSRTEMERDLACRPEPRYAIFFDRSGHPIDEYVINCLSVAERLSINGNRSFNIDGYAIDPATIPNGGYIRRALFNAQPKYYQVRIPGIKKVIFNGPATIVFWGDGEKTVVKAQKGETIDHEKGLALAITKYALGNKGNYYNTIRKLLEESSPIVGGEK